MGFEYKVTGRVFDLRLLRKIVQLVAPYKMAVLIAVILTCISSCIGPSIPFFVQRTIDFYVKSGDAKGLYFQSLLIIGLLLAQSGIGYLLTYRTAWLGQRAIFHLRNKIFDHILDLRLSIYDKTPVGTMITRSVSDVESVADIFSQGLISITGDALQIIILLFLMFYTNWQLTLVSIAVFPFLLFASYIFKERIKVSFQEVRTQVGRLNSFLQEHITGMSIVQVFNREEKEYANFKEINAEHRDANIRSVFYYSVFFPVIEILSAVSMACIVWYGASRLAAGNIHPGIGEITGFFLFINLLFRPVRQIADKFNTLQMGIVAADRIFQVMNLKASTPNEGKIQSPIIGRVEFKDVSFAYNPEIPVLKHISFKVEKGQMVAIVGHTGSGKSSIISLVNRLYEYQQGEILIDEAPIEQYELTHLRRNIAFVLQDVFLFSDSIENNIRLFNPAISIQQIEAAAKMVGADKFIEKLPNGYQYEVEERGATLSTGQRQLVSFIRALLQNPSILVLDEATSSVDPETEELLQHATEKLLEGRTSIVIAHRLSTIQHADRIIVLDKGEIIESGTHAQLLEQSGRYKKLYDLQFSELAI